MMIDDSTTFQEGWIQYRTLERIGKYKRILFDISFHGQSTLMTKSVAEQILGKLLEITSIYLENNSLDIEPILEAELTEACLYHAF